MTDARTPSALDIRMRSLELATSLAATGRLDPSLVLTEAASYRDFLTTPAPSALSADDTAVRVPRDLAAGHAARLRRIADDNPPSPVSAADRALADLLDPDPAPGPDGSDREYVVLAMPSVVPVQIAAWLRAHAASSGLTEEAVPRREWADILDPEGKHR